MINFPLDPTRAARLLVLATRMARPRLRSEESTLHAVADQHAAKLSVAIRYAFAKARSAMRNALVHELNAPYASALAVITLRQELKDVLPKHLLRMRTAGGEVGAELLGKRLRTAEEFRTAKDERRTKIDFTYDAKTQSAIDWADKHAAELIDGISETSREAINNAVAEFLETGKWDEYKDEILAAVGDEDRADRIARNESMVAVHEGQREAWDQAVDEGLLTGDEEREWIVVGDDKVCPICEGLDGKRAKLGESYSTEDGEFDGPPAHVSCRCSEGIVS